MLKLFILWYKVFCKLRDSRFKDEDVDIFLVLLAPSRYLRQRITH